jgi:hypothetical protein
MQKMVYSNKQIVFMLQILLTIAIIAILMGVPKKRK